MDKKHFDHIENRIRQASNDILVPVTEEAWKKMEVVLDNAFQKKRRRGGIWWWFFGIFFATVLVYSYQKFTSTLTDKASAYQPVSTKTQASTSKKAKPDDVPLHGKTTPVIIFDQQEHALDNNKKNNKILRGESSHDLPKANRKVSIIADVDEKKLADKTSYSKKLGNSLAKFTRTKNIVPGIDSQKGMQGSDNGKDDSPAYNKKTSTGQHDNKPIENNGTESKIDARTSAVGIDKPIVDSHQKTPAISIKPASPVTLPDSIDQQKATTKKSAPVKPDKIAPRGFYFTIAAGADASGIKSVSTDNIKPVYGAGFGYRFNKKFSIQTGFYAGTKIYKAGPDDYKVKPGSYVAKIISADAVCIIYDIPLTVKYDFFQRRKYNFYATAGLSSFILKRETYDMHFFNPMGAYRHVAYTYKDNTNYLSVVNISLGFEHKISNTLFVQAEPYIKLPISGLGEGQVKLYSAGLQLGFKYQPITNKRRKK